jgi:hypothetical protein
MASSGMLRRVALVRTDVSEELSPSFIRVPSSWMLRCVALVRTDVSEERIASTIKVKRIGEVGTTLAVTSNMQRGTPLRVLNIASSVDGTNWF